ncbi:unnamed protein product [Echinostoma caproni]|uniref:Zinc finger CCCH domain-containing protein 14 n=1 Tax=Echinostoma caproni TaxID=27848 RepID=A0A183APR4_9TREM|nr:unnamed protein product [Echinostoma caproni]
MNRVPICYYYQAGSCRNGDTCPYAHPTVRCRSFTSTGWCPYGYNCHFWHDHSVKPPTPNPVRKPCQFFLNNQCKYGDRCTFSHDLETEDKKQRTYMEFRCEQKPARVTLANQGDSTNRPARPAFIRPRNSASGVPLDGVTKSEVCRLQHLEVERFLKSFPSEELREMQSFDGGRVFHLKFSSSDPDWAYDVREVVLNIQMDKMYPVEPLQVTVLDKDHLPGVLVEHLNMAMGSWIRYKHQQFTRMNRVELYMRSFFQWLDRNLENLFTQGLRKYKAQLAGQMPNSTGLTSSDSADKSMTRSDSPLIAPGEISSPGVVKLVPSPQTIEAQSANGSTDELKDSSSDSIKFNSTVPFSTTHKDNAGQNENSDNDDDPDDNDDNSFDESGGADEREANSSYEDYDVGEWIDPVTQKESNKDESAEVSAAQPQASESKTDDPVTTKPVPVNGPTQSLYLTDLRLCGKAGTLTPCRFTCILHCTRCRLPFNWCFNFPGHTTVTNNPDDSRLRSLPPHHVSCARCKHPMELVFHGVVAHAFENRIGTLHLAGCVADDVPPKQSTIAVFCTGCNKTIKFNVSSTICTC